jgi:hypothetical protein
LAWVKADERPVVVAVALGAVAGRDPLPGPRRDVLEQRISPPSLSTGEHGMAAGDRQDIADAAALQKGPKLGVGTVDLIAGHPTGRDPGVQRPRQHPRGQGRLGRKPHLVRDPSGAAAVGISRPGPGQVQLPVDHAVPSLAGVHQQDRDLGVLHAARGAGVLALHPHRGGALLQVPGLVHHQHRLRVTQVLDQVVADLVTDAVFVPHRPAQQVLHPIGAGVPGVLSQRPAVLAWQVGQQPHHERPSPPAWLHPPEPARDPAQQLLQARLPPGRLYLYAVAHGHRLISGCPHTTGSSTAAALVRWPAHCRPDRQGHDPR